MRRMASSRAGILNQVQRKPRLSTRIAAALAMAAIGSGAAAPLAAAAPPSVSAPSAAVIETSTGTVVYAKDGYQPRGMASTTKLMTALTALDTQHKLSTVYTAPAYGGSPAETKINLRAGEKMTFADLLRAMMLPSANDAAQTVAVRVGGTKARFVQLMNAKAKAMGLTHTHFTNPVGLDSPTHRTTAIELARIGAAAHENPFLRATVANKYLTLKSGDHPRSLTNRNLVLGANLGNGTKINGMKTGHTTAAGYSLVGSATTAGGLTYVSAVLGEGSEDGRDVDTVKLLKWASTLLENGTLVAKGQSVVTVPVAHGTADEVALVAPVTLKRAVPRGAKITLTPIGVPATLEAPVTAGTKVATARIKVNGKLVGTTPLVTKAAVEHQGLVAAALAYLGDHWKGLLVVLLLVLGGTLTIARGMRSSSRATPRRGPRSSEPSERTTAP
jgi:D-alanyl-D-alanine carboxypeptidase (penicillin-binding protein 5/6)